MFTTIKNQIQNAFTKAKTSLSKAFRKSGDVMADTTAEGYIDTGVKIIIGVVIGGVILAGLYALFNTTILPTLTTKITSMFSYSGT